MYQLIVQEGRKFHMVCPDTFTTYCDAVKHLREHPDIHAQVARRVDHLLFNISTPQIVRCPWRNCDRLCLFVGKCVGCGTRCYEFIDGENDPRGMLGNHAEAGPTADDSGMVGPDATACFVCMNEEDRYTRVMRKAQRRWHIKPEGVTA